MPFVSDEFMAEAERFAEAVRREIARRAEPSFVQRTPGVCGGRAYATRVSQSGPSCKWFGWVLPRRTC